MPNLTNKGNFIISATSTPTSSEIANQYKAKSIKVNYESLASENSGRNDAGKMIIEWIYRKIRKLEIEMPSYSNNEASKMSTLLNAVQGKEYWITYFDNLTNAEKTIKVYTSSSSLNCFNGVLYNGMWTGLSFNCIELSGE